MGRATASAPRRASNPGSSAKRSSAAATASSSSMSARSAPLPAVQLGLFCVVEQLRAGLRGEALDLRVQFREAGAAADDDQLDAPRGPPLRRAEGAQQAGVVLARLPGAHREQA